MKSAKLRFTHTHYRLKNCAIEMIGKEGAHESHPVYKGVHGGERT